jgi:hypothetical protein
MLANMFRSRRTVRRGPARRPLCLDPLHERALPSATPIHLAGGVLAIHGTPAGDVVTVKDDAANPNQLDVYFNNPNAPAATFALNKVKKISFTGGAGNDTFTNATSIPLVARAGKGNDVLIGGSGHNVLIGGPGQDTLVGGTGTNVLRAGSGSNTLHGGLGTNEFFADKHAQVIANGHKKNVVHGGAKFEQSSSGDLVTTLTDANGNKVGTAEISTETDDNGVTHTNVQVEIDNGPADVTLALTIDPDGTGTNLYTLGSITTDPEGEGEFEVTDPANFPTVVDGKGTLTASDKATGGTNVLMGTFVSVQATTALSAQLMDSAGFTVGEARFDPSSGEFGVRIEGAPANTTYTVFLNGDAKSGVMVGTFTTDSEGFGHFELSAGVPTLAAGSTITIADASGATVLTGTFQPKASEGGDDNGGDDNGGDGGSGGGGSDHLIIHH